MTIVKHHKVVAALPAQLEADAMYFVRKDAGFEVHLTNSTGIVVAYPANYVTTEGLAARTGTAGALGFRNKIINGKMEVAQRGVNFPSLNAGGGYLTDRFRYISVGISAYYTASVQADAPVNEGLQNSLRITVTTADTSIAADDLLCIDQLIEGFNTQDLKGRGFTLSFWVKSPKVGIHSVFFSSSNADRSFVAEYVVTSANTWEKKTVVVPDGMGVGTWNTTNGIGLQLGWTLACGSTYQGTKNVWQSGARRGTPNQVNCLDTAGNVFAITGIQLEAGTVATPFEHRPYSLELSLCQRYYEVVTTGGYWLEGVSAKTIYKDVQSSLKRALPTIIMPGSVNSCWAALGNDVTPQAWSTSSISQTAFSINAYHSNGIAGIKPNTYRIDAEL